MWHGTMIVLIDGEGINFILKSELVSSCQFVAPSLALMRHSAKGLMAKKLPEVMHQFSLLSE
jgi:hypothetical protein